MIVVKRNTNETMKQTTINDYVRYRNSVLDHESRSDNGWIGIPKVNTYNLLKYIINSGWILECSGL